MRCAITGGAGFLGSHLADLILQQDHEVLAFDAQATEVGSPVDEVLALDALSAGSRANIAHLLSHPGFTFRECDVRQPLQVDGPVNIVFNLAGGGRRR